MNLEKGLWFHAHLAFEVIPGTRCCTLIKCLWCVDHTCSGVCSTVSEGSYCEFWLLWSPWHNLPLCCVPHFAVMTGLKCRVEEDYELLLGHRWCRFLWYILRRQRVTPEASDLSWKSHWIYVWTVKSIFSAPFWLREKLDSEVLITDLWAHFSQCCSEKLIICTSREVLKC